MLMSVLEADGNRDMESPPLALRRCFIYVRYCLTDQLGDQTDVFGTEATTYADAVRDALG